MADGDEEETETRPTVEVDTELEHIRRTTSAIAARLKVALDTALAGLALGENLAGSALRAWPTSSVSRLLVERLHSFALLFNAYLEPLDGSGGERGTSLEELMQLEADFRLHQRLGCARSRVHELHGAYGGGKISLLELAQLLCHLGDTPAIGPPFVRQP